MAFEQRFEGDRGVSYKDIWRRSVPDRSIFANALRKAYIFGNDMEFSVAGVKLRIGMGSGLGEGNGEEESRMCEVRQWGWGISCWGPNAAKKKSKYWLFSMGTIEKVLSRRMM